MGLYIILMGVQGAGKGVQANFISQTYDIPHVSTGDLFRAMKSREDELAQKVQQIMASGALIDDETTNAIVADRLAQDDAQSGVILDGYPRNTVQAEFLAQYLAERDESVTGVLYLDLDLYVAFKRAFGRVTASDGESYNYYYKPDAVSFTVEKHPDDAYPPRLVASKDGETLKRRSDDADAMAVIKRIDTYLDNTMPLLQYYEDKDLLHKIDADQTIDAVNDEIQTVIDQLS
jgi:adenylate kinase